MRTGVVFRLVTCGCAVVLIADCAGPRNPRVAPNRPPPPITETEQDIKLMLSYDENSDGTVTRQELEDGLHRQFAAADLDHDGRIDLKEMQAENDRRFRAFGTEASPLIDWNQDGYIDFDEFASTPRSVFEEMDKNHDAKLDGNELRLPNAPRPAQPRPVPRQTMSIRDLSDEESPAGAAPPRPASGPRRRPLAPPFMPRNVSFPPCGGRWPQRTHLRARMAAGRGRRAR